MNWVDIVIIFFVFVSAISGLTQGAVRTAFGFAGFIGGLILAGRFYRDLSDVLFPANETWGVIVAYIIIFLVVGIVASVVGAIVSKLVHATLLGWLDRLLGFFLGVFVGLITTAAMVALIARFIPPAQDVIAGSGLARFLLDRFPFILSLLPEDFSSVRNIFM